MTALVTQQADLTCVVTVTGGVFVKATEHELTALAAAKVAIDQLRHETEPEDVTVEGIDLDGIEVTDEDRTEIEIVWYEKHEEEAEYTGVVLGR